MKIDYYVENGSYYIILLAHSQSERKELDTMALFMENADTAKYPEFTKLISQGKHLTTAGIVYRVGSAG